MDGVFMYINTPKHVKIESNGPIYLGKYETKQVRIFCSGLLF